MGNDHKNSDKLTFYVNAMSRKFIMFVFAHMHMNEVYTYGGC